MSVSLDDKDLKIIELLRENSDYTTRQIARRTLLPVTTVHNRIRKLKESGVIKRFTVELDPDKVGRGFRVYVLIKANLYLLKKNKRSQYDLVNDLKKFWFVEKAEIVSGGADIVAVIAVRDVREFDDALLNHVQKIEEIENTQSLIVIH